jgi:suppressor of G2 allele of SKP1
MSTQADLGAKALAARDYTSAIAHYTTALSSSQSPIWLTQRSTAYHRLGQYEDALRDAEDAVLVARARGKRELIASAQFRRAIALYSLGRLGDARLVLTWARKLNEKEKGLAMWQAKVAGDYEKLPEGEEGEKGRRVVVEEWPTEFQGEMKQGKKEEATKVEDKGKEKERGEVAQGHHRVLSRHPRRRSGMSGSSRAITSQSLSLQREYQRSKLKSKLMHEL